MQSGLAISQSDLGFDLSNIIMRANTYRDTSYLEILKKVLVGTEILISVET